ncbi:MAG: prepilin-type N-terminal cleavage/methylation domain-containing protein [Leptospiraceae bacterium]|nr:prepilin-type N-terminal cleavage/methylation domain-containing protein [Leptospiraceae bacterium]
MRSPKILLHKKGITLVEMVVVVMLVGILATITISSLMNFIRPSVGGTVEKFQQALKYCYQNAIIQNLVVEMHIDIEKQRYTVFRIMRTDEGLKPRKIMEVALPSNSKIIAVYDLRGLKYDTGIIKIPYTYTGVSEDYTIQFGEGSVVKKSVLVYRYNGKSTIKNGEVVRKIMQDGTTKLEESQ